MIRILGVRRELFHHIRETYPEMIYKSYEDSLIISFAKDCNIEFGGGELTISRGDENINILAIDFWRLEIE